jgi:hypothetical protein
MDIFRGDTFKFDFTANLEDGTAYEFQVGDTLKEGVKDKLSNSRYVLFKTINFEKPTETIPIVFSHEETKRWCEGDKILEIELTDTQGNVYTLVQEKIKIVGDVINE